MKRVVVGLSGGVDSSVAAYLLKEQGYQVIGLFMKNWHDDSVTISDQCPWLEDSQDALLVAEKLGIPFQTVDLSEQYKEKIVDYMFSEYQNGRTPNPDVLCNREIKFDVFLEVAQSLGADYVATGHYCIKDSQEVEGKTVYRLIQGKDKAKDQSYFLCQLSQNQLSKALFPIGELEKSKVREIAKELDLVTAEKKDSQGLCFIGKVRLPEFLQQKLEPKTGNVVEISPDHPCYKERENKLKLISSKETFLKCASEPYHYKEKDGKLLGQHQGAHFFTIGQRKGLAIGGTPLPLFVIGINTDTNTVYVGQGSDHPGLLNHVIRVKGEDIHWIRKDLKLKNEESIDVLSRIRYRQPLQKAVLHQFKKDLFVEFNDPQSAITPGQFVTWQTAQEVLGSGVIS